ncbi:MAG: hypothetical protein KAT70_03320 [Thermoplasmata archaeon]|nr:hypothetical protein [Thermoplasmata archaeon]
MSAPLFLIYYFLPENMGGVDKRIIPLLMVTLVAVFEAARVSRGKRLPGLRGYERRRPASFAYAIVGISLCFLLVPMDIALPAFFGLAFIDPFISLVRHRGFPTYPIAPIALYALMTSLWFFSVTNMWKALVLGVTGAIVAVASEKPQNRWVDDDFLMLFMPASFLYAMASIMGLTW